VENKGVNCESPPRLIGNNIYLCLLQVGNALTDDFNDQLGIFQFMWSSGMISDQTFKLLNLLCDFQSVEHPSKSCEKILEIADNELGNIDPYSVFTPPCHGSANQRVKRTHVSLPFLVLLLFYFCFILSLRILILELGTILSMIRLVITTFPPTFVQNFINKLNSVFGLKQPWVYLLVVEGKQTS
jgi:hypothetical protein